MGHQDDDVKFYLKTNGIINSPVNPLQSSTKYITPVHCTTSSVMPVAPSECVAKADTGATRHYWKIKDTPALSSLTPISDRPSVSLPYSSSITVSSK
eukprot:7316862-Ditylum_brightwellii.AAC.1